MKQKIYQVDAFTDKLFRGNPAAVCPLESWLSDDLMQKIAFENNLSETAFYVREGIHYNIRWFTPTVEVDLCGHATLATAYVLFNWENHEGDKIIFKSMLSGELEVVKSDDLLTLNFPADFIEPAELTTDFTECFNIRPIHTFRGKTDYMLVFDNERSIETLIPDLVRISKLDCRGVIVTARGNNVDFVSRFFGPQSGVDEDPVTGSAHTTLTPYWSKQLGKKELTAVQLSNRKGYLKCSIFNDRVEISGECRLYLKGEIFIKES
ncbi:MAG TPA: PhzF family phenazine biosynthesis protein [Bacteroidales bacterium]|nr:PhzF family phenazine biosynthesis protein [Bacteroidales bacterium]